MGCRQRWHQFASGELPEPSARRRRGDGSRPRLDATGACVISHARPTGQCSTDLWIASRSIFVGVSGIQFRQFHPSFA